MVVFFIRLVIVEEDNSVVTSEPCEDGWLRQRRKEEMLSMWPARSMINSLVQYICWFTDRIRNEVIVLTIWSMRKWKSEWRSCLRLWGLQSKLGSNTWSNSLITGNYPLSVHGDMFSCFFHTKIIPIVCWLATTATLTVLQMLSPMCTETHHINMHLFILITLVWKVTR